MLGETERSKFLVDLLAEVDGFDAELFKPIHPVSKQTKDQVIGVLSPWLKKGFALVRYYNRQIKLTAVDREYDDAEKCAEDPELCAMRIKYALLNEIMWAAIRAEHNLWTANSIGVRIGWKVVTSEPEPGDDGFKQFLAMIMGRKK